MLGSLGAELLGSFLDKQTARCSSQYPIRSVRSLKSHSCVIGDLNLHIALKFDRCLSSNADERLVKFQSDWIILSSNLVA